MQTTLGTGRSDMCFAIVGLDNKLYKIQGKDIKIKKIKTPCIQGCRQRLAQVELL